MLITPRKKEESVEEEILLRDERKELSSKRARNIDPLNRCDVPRQSAQPSYDTRGPTTLFCLTTFTAL